MIPMDNFSDVLVVGGGAAGLYAAIAATEIKGIRKVTLLTPDELGTGGCSKKTHGINAALNEKDSWESHERDTLEGGGWINNPALVKIMCQRIPDRIKELESWGVRFAKSGERYDVGTYGGSSFSRSIHWYDITGLEIVNELVKRVILKGCFVHEGRWVVELLIHNGRCFGVLALNKLGKRFEEYRARSVIFATGGGACVYPISSISSDKIATGLVLGFRAEAPMVDMEMVQFHPTGLLLPGSQGNGSLLEEEMRAKGGILLNSLCHRYMYDYDDRGELATRDIVARSSYLEIIKGRGTKNKGVIFDISRIDKNILSTRLPKTVKRLRSWGIDLMAVNEIEISPTAHFLMGGLVIDERCETGIKGLFACGEDAGGIHGANRLGGNGVAEALVFGHLCGVSAANAALGSDANPPASLLPKPLTFYAIDNAQMVEIDNKIKQIMWNGVGVVRWQAQLMDAWNKICEIRDILKPTMQELAPKEISNYGKNFWGGRILLNKLDIATIITKAAITRKHSIGAHYIADEESEGEPFYNVYVRWGTDHLPKTQIVHLPENRRTTIST